jgi:phage regulator Rha-like protein
VPCCSGLGAEKAANGTQGIGRRGNQTQRRTHANNERASQIIEVRIVVGYQESFAQTRAAVVAMKNAEIENLKAAFVKELEESKKKEAAAARVALTFHKVTAEYAQKGDQVEEQKATLKHYIACLVSFGTRWMSVRDSTTSNRNPTDRPG